MMMVSEFLANPSSLLLGILLGPIALVIVLISYLKLIWRVGTNFPNVANFVTLDNAYLMNPTLAMSAKQLSSKIRDPNDSLTAESLLEMFISQCSRVNPLIQSVVGTRYPQAREEAKAIDRLVQKNQIPRDCSEFWGVPIVVKECFEMEGMPFTGGLLGRKDVIGVSTGPVISKVQQEGAIVFASTNTSEACMYHESVNHVYGATHNPYDLRRTAGGSSGGCASAVASCCAPFAVTSDVGGSTRIPALYNCLFGHKPTGGVISNRNTFPLVGTHAVNRFCQLGPTCRHSEDLWPLFQSMLSRDPASPLVDETIVSSFHSRLSAPPPPHPPLDHPSRLPSPHNPHLPSKSDLLLALLFCPPRDHRRHHRCLQTFRIPGRHSGV
jgi:Asp-tRNA(Asn)/Glu-tRNA(Gln) amidotransferase A subunit family amidase